MSDTDNLINIENTKNEYNSINLTYELNNFLLQISKFNGLSFDKCQKILLSSTYLNNIKNILQNLFLSKHNNSLKRKLGLLGIIIYHPQTLFEKFNYNSYLNYINNNNVINNFFFDNNVELGLDNNELGLDNVELGLDNVELGLNNVELGLDNNELGLDNNVELGLDNNELGLDKFEIENIEYVNFYDLYYISIKIKNLINDTFNYKKNNLEDIDKQDKNNKNDKNDKNNKNKLKYLIIEYESIFNKWKNYDARKEIKNLINTFWNLELTKQQITKSIKYNEEERSNILLELIRQQEEIKIFIKKIGGIKGLSELNNSIPIVIDNNIINLINSNLQLAFWDNIEKEILEKDNYDTLLNVLLELKNIIYNCLGESRIKNDIENIFDIDIIIQQLKYSTIEIDSCLIFNNLFYDLLFNLDAPINDDKNKEIFENLKTQLNIIINYYSSIIQDLNNNTISNNNNNNKKKQIKNMKIKCIINCIGILYEFYFHKFKEIYKIKVNITNIK
jgi:hypothetical protein